MSLIARLLVGGVFVYSGWSKLIHPSQEFQYVIEQYQAFPSFAAQLLSHTIPWVEFIFGVFLALGFVRFLSARILAALCIAFLSLLGSAVWRKIDLSNCGCFGSNMHLTPVQAFAFDSSLLVLLLYLVFSSKRFFELDEWLQRK